MAIPTALEQALTNWERIHKQTVRLMKVTPDDQYDWRPCDSAMTLGELMNHLYQAEMGLAEAAVHGAYPSEFPSYTSTAELLAAYDTSHTAAIEKVRALSPEAWEEMITPFGPQSTMPRLALLTLALEHEIHHRGQLYVYLRMLGCEVPALFG
jgi:uncharacterized damage-inducible protein DinB